MTDALAVELLPKQSSTSYELANLGAMVEAWPVDVDAVRVQSDPMLCDVDQLPYLAFDRGLTLWNDAWPEDKKRRYIRDAWIYKRLEGTPLGVEAYLNLADGAVIREILPPNSTFAMPDTGEIGHAALLALMPQLRLYYHFPDRDLLQTVAVADRSYAGRMFAYPDQARALGRYPVLFDPATGVETPLSVVSYDEVGTNVVLSKQGYVGTGFYSDVSFADQAVAGTPLVEDPITYSTEDPEMQTLRVAPPLRRFELASDFSSSARVFAMPDLGDLGTYDLLTIWDPSRVPAGVTSVANAALYANWSWLGIAPYNQILTVAVPGTPPRLPFVMLTANAGYVLDGADRSSLLFAVDAVATAKRGGDRILLDLAPTFAGTRPAPIPEMSAI